MIPIFFYTRRKEKKRNKIKNALKKLFEEEDEHKLEAITKSVEQLFERGEEALRKIHNDREIYEVFKTDKAFDKFIEWRTNFMKNL